jgi:hypothetical protein
MQFRVEVILILVCIFWFFGCFFYIFSFIGLFFGFFFDFSRIFCKKTDSMDNMDMSQMRKVKR